MTAPAERPVVFGRSQHLVGVECRPAPGSLRPEMPAALFINAGIVHRIGPHRIYVQIARALAEAGVASFRFDLSGIGESRTAADAVASREKTVRADLADALDHLHRRMGAHRTVPIGLCSGADRAFDAALEHDTVVGAILMDPDVHITRGHRMHEVRAALGRKRTWASIVTGRYLRSALASLADREPDPGPQRPPRDGLVVTHLPSREVREQEIARLLDRGVALHWIFTGGLLERYNHRTQLYEAYPAVDLKTRSRLTWFPEANHTFSAEAAQRDLVEAVRNWYETTFGNGVEG